MTGRPVTMTDLALFLVDAIIPDDTTYTGLAARICARYELTERAPDPGPPCLDRYAGDMVCSQPSGHPIVVTNPDTWHRYGTVRWC